MSERLLTVDEVGKRCSLSRTTIHYMCKRGEFPEPVRIGRAIRWRESDVDKWIAALAERQPSGEPSPATTGGAS